MEYGLFLGCQIPARVNQYELSTRAVLSRLDVKLVDIRQFNCCGYPMRNSDQKAFLLSAVRNLALAEKEDLDILVLCKCCYGSLKAAQHLMTQEGDTQREVNEMLDNMGLRYEGRKNVRHILSVLYHEIGADALKSRISRKFKGLKIATHYGCHALRPSKITEFDDPVTPSLFDELVNLTGATSVEWSSKLECCGAPLMGINDDLSMDLTRKKINSGKEAEADFFATACPYCQIQFDTVQNMMITDQETADCLASILYPQLLGMCMGIGEEALGIKMNQIDISGIQSFLSEE